MAEWHDDPLAKQVTRGEPGKGTIVCFYFRPEDGPLIAMAPRMEAALRGIADMYCFKAPHWAADHENCDMCRAFALLRELDAAREATTDAPAA